MAGEQSSGRMLKGPPGKEEAFSPLPPTLAAASVLVPAACLLREVPTADPCTLFSPQRPARHAGPLALSPLRHGGPDGEEARGAPGRQRWPRGPESRSECISRLGASRA